MAHINNLKIIQWNCRGIMNKKSDIITLSKNFDILLLSETFLKPGKFFSLDRNFNFIRADRPNLNRGGLAIAIRKGINFTRISTITNMENYLETLSISINTSLGEFLIVSVYRVPSNENNISEDSWKNFLDSVYRVNSNQIFIAGDFNAHHYLWGSTRSCPNGESLFTALEDTNLICLNNGKSTLVNRPDENPSILDLSFINPNLFTNCSHEVLDDPLGSDHYPVVTNLGIQIPISIFFSHKYNLKKTDWNLFDYNLESSLTSNLNNFNSLIIEPVDKYNLFVQCIDQAIVSASPPTPQSNKLKNKPGMNHKPFVPTPWWNEECEKAIQNRREASSKFRKQSNYENYLQYKKCEAIAKRTFIQARRNSFQEFCNNLNRTTPITKVWRTVKSFKNRFAQPATASCSADMETITKLHELSEEMCPPPRSFSIPFHLNFTRTTFLNLLLPSQN